MRRSLVICLLLLTACGAQPAASPTAAALPLPTSAPTTAADRVITPTTATSPAAIVSSIDADGYHTLGDPAAPVTLTDYSDYF